MPKPATATDDFAERLDLALKALNLSCTQLAAQVGVDKSLISRWMSGRMRPTGYNLARISEVLARAKPGFNTLYWTRPRPEFDAMFWITGSEGAARHEPLPRETPASAAGPDAAAGSAPGAWGSDPIPADGTLKPAHPGLPLPVKVAGKRPLRLDRRSAMIGGGVMAAGFAASWMILPHLTAPPASASPEIKELVQQALVAVQQGTPEGINQATGLMRHVVDLHPDYADGWGLLAIAYARAAQAGSPESSKTQRERCMTAASHARALDARNAYATVAATMLLPNVGHWTESERALRTAMTDHPGNQMLLTSLANMLISVGRCRAAADAFDDATATGPPSPVLLYSRVRSLWSAGRLDEADHAMDEAIALYPGHFAIWFTRFYLLLYTGRAQEALAMNASEQDHPTGIPPSEFASVGLVARAMVSKKASDVEKAIRVHLDAARRGAGYAVNTMQFACALGQADLAFEVANGYFFGRGLYVPELRYTAEQRVYTSRSNRATQHLFYPSTAPMRSDPRFAALVGELRLQAYWSQLGERPDYQAR